MLCFVLLQLYTHVANTRMHTYIDSYKPCPKWMQQKTLCIYYNVYTLSIYWKLICASLLTIQYIAHVAVIQKLVAFLHPLSWIQWEPWFSSQYRYYKPYWFICVWNLYLQFHPDFSKHTEATLRRSVSMNFWPDMNQMALAYRDLKEKFGWKKIIIITTLDQRTATG